MKKIKILKEGNHVLPKGTIATFLATGCVKKYEEDQKIFIICNNIADIIVDFSEVEPLYPHKGIKVPKEGIPFADGKGCLLDCGQNLITYDYKGRKDYLEWELLLPNDKDYELKRTLPDTIEVCAECIKEPCECKKDCLILKVIDDGSLFIVVGNEMIGEINRNGKCGILNTEFRVGVYEKWRESGMLVDSTPVEWRGGEYIINEFCRLARKDIPCGFIYDFASCSYISVCDDENIVRFKHNNRPIGF